MNGFLVAERYPGALTCVVIGAPGEEARTDFAHYREILWCTDGDNRADPNRCFGQANVHRLPLAQPPPQRTAALEHFIRRDPRRLPSLFVSETILQADAEAYGHCVAEIHALLEQNHRARLTRQKDGFSWQQNLLRNAAAYAQRRVPAAWHNALSGFPAFVCGAGPSLDVSAPGLAAHATAGIVFAADSALRTLARHGVRADFTVSIDLAKVPEKCLPMAAEFAPGRVILSAVSPPTWTTALPPDRQFFLSSNQITLDWLAALGVALTPLNANENCGNTALELARFLGCAPIYLFGLDLALADDNPAARHASGADASIYTHSGFDAAQQHPRVPGNYAETVPTWAPTDWRALDARLASWPARLVHNVNDRGARFRNTTLMHPRDFSLPAAHREKSSALAQLAAADAERADKFHPRLRAIGTRASSEVGPLRAALRAEGPAAVVARLRKFFADNDAGRAFGAFSLKLMPHLLPPTEGDAAFWSGLLDEFAALAQLAASSP